MEQHRFIYQNRFSPEKYARYVHIPQGPGGHRRRTGAGMNERKEGTNFHENLSL